VAEEVWALQHPAYRAEAALIGVSDLPPLRDTIQSLRECGETFLGYREDNGDLVGAVSYEQEEENELYTICRLMVHPDFHRQGIGRTLLQRLLHGEQVNQAITWTVTAEARNYPAIALYEGFGFVRLDSFEPMKGIKLIRLVRPVSPT